MNGEECRDMSTKMIHVDYEGGFILKHDLMFLKSLNFCIKRKLEDACDHIAIACGFIIKSY